MAPSKPITSAQTLDPYGLFETRPTFSHVATSTGPSRIITTAGQVGADKNGKVPADYDAQIELAFKNLSRCLEAAGASVRDVIKLTYYIVNYDLYGRRYFKYLFEFLDGHRPATTLVPVTQLAKPDFLFEIEAVAAIRENPLQKVDVVVVGGGISGLQAARDLQKRGLSCVVLEARDRVGGKTLSVDPLGEGKVVDMGAAWINSTNQSRMYAMAKLFGLQTVVQNTVGDIIQQDVDGSVSTYPYGALPKVYLKMLVLEIKINYARNYPLKEVWMACYLLGNVLKNYATKLTSTIQWLQVNISISTLWKNLRDLRAVGRRQWKQ
jgi:monoamine oxidase